MRLVRNYFLKEWAFSFFISLGIFTLAFSIGNLVKIVELIINKGVSPLKVLELFFLMIPFSLTYTIPISTLISTLLTFGRASADNEIVTLKSSGISCKKISLPFLSLGLTLSLVSFIFMDKVLPYTHYKAREVMFNIGKRNPTAYLEPGSFIKSFKDYIIFFYGMKKNMLKNIRIYVCEEGKSLRTIIADKALIGQIAKDGLTLRLFNGSIDEMDPKKPGKFYKLNFKQYTVSLNLKDIANPKIDKKPEDYSIGELKVEIAKLKDKEIDPLSLISELNKRYAQPFICLAFILIGLPIGIRTQRKGKSIGYATALLIIIFYYVIFLISESLILNRKLKANIGHWIPTITIFILGIYFYSQMDRVKK